MLKYDDDDDDDDENHPSGWLRYSKKKKNEI